MAVKKVQKAEDVKVETPVVDETPEVVFPEHQQLQFLKFVSTELKLSGTIVTSLPQFIFRSNKIDFSH